MALFGDDDTKKALALVDKMERRVQALEHEVKVLRDEVQSLRSVAVSSLPPSSFAGSFPSFSGSPSSSASSSSPGAFASVDDRMRADPEVMEFIQKKQMINAIKRVRDATGLGLKEAKDVVERLA